MKARDILLIAAGGFLLLRHGGIASVLTSQEGPGSVGGPPAVAPIVSPAPPAVAPIVSPAIRVPNVFPGLPINLPGLIGFEGPLPGPPATGDIFGGKVPPTGLIPWVGPPVLGGVPGYDNPPVTVPIPVDIPGRPYSETWSWPSANADWASSGYLHKVIAALSYLDVFATGSMGSYVYNGISYVQGMTLTVTAPNIAILDSALQTLMFNGTSVNFYAGNIGFPTRTVKALA